VIVVLPSKVLAILLVLAHQSLPSVLFLLVLPKDVSAAWKLALAR
jgi:hypothetical protein